ncbi:MAG TPA: M23 family metallopeptidase [Anaerolineaceae bacterium]|nr:M23 family metallopeptidase [Anaerolineaceae bacterium]
MINKSRFQYIVSAILIILSLLGHTSPVRAQDSLPPSEADLLALIESRVQTEHVTRNVLIEGNLAKGSVVETRDGIFVTGSGSVFLAEWDGSRWDLHFEGTPEFRRLLASVPDTIFSPDVKILLDYENSNLSVPILDKQTNATGYKLPFPYGDRYYISRAWASGPCPHGSTNPYNAVDFVMPLNRTIVAARSGYVYDVVESRTICGCVDTNAANWVVIRHTPDDGLSEWYLHIAQNGALVNEGDPVVQGQPIALSHQIGNTCGSSTCAPGTCPSACNPGAHLHFHIRNNNTGQYLYTTFDDVGAIVGCQSYTSGNYYDITAPVTTATLSGTSGEHGWYVSPVTVTLTATDDWSGVASTRYNLNSSGWITYSGPFAIGNNGQNSLRYQSVDGTGNWESPKSVQVPIDTQAPTGSLELNEGAELAYQTLVKVETAAQDTASGVTSFQIRDAGGAWTGWMPITESLYWLLPAVTDQDHAVEVQYKDYAGHLSLTYSSSIWLDLYPDQATSVNYILTKSTFGIAAVEGSSENYQVRGTVAQPSLIGHATSPKYDLWSGYWARLLDWLKVYLPLLVR